jgi:NAD(P)-dependent dehydrogenase (short-subunit alcohol dehydrogenase family)
MTTSKSIFITGGASGLGREVGRYFGERGWFVGLADVNAEGLAQSAKLIPEGKSSTHILDVTDRDQWKSVVAEFGAASGGVMNVMFNNAGIGSGGPIQDMADEDIDKLIAVNFTGVLNATRACFDMLKATPDSCILYTASAAGIYGVADLSVYSATKFAVRGLAESHDIELRKYGIKSRSLMPGFVDTGIIADVVEGTNQTGKERLEGAGVEVSPVSIIGPAAWEAVHGEKVHKPVNSMAKKLWFAARWMPGRLRNQQAQLLNADEVLGSP